MNKTQLIQFAKIAREKAVAPYSNFKVGAALESKNGEVTGGCNIENATFGLTLCAERVAIFKAISEGITEFTSLTVITDTDELTPPCGACRQIIWEFCGDIPVTMSNLDGKSESVWMRVLMPRAFDKGFLS